MKISLFSIHSATGSHRTEQENGLPHDDRSVSPSDAASEPTQPESQEETPRDDCTLHLVANCTRTIYYKKYC